MSRRWRPRDAARCPRRGPAARSVRWRFDTFIGMGGLTLAVGYALGFLRLRRPGDSWPVGRLVAWVAGCLVLVFTSSSGVKAYGSAMFSVHMGDHMALNMFIPVLLVLGGPVTLALRVLTPAGDAQPPGPREWLLWLVHSKVTAFLAHPVTAFVLFVASLYIVYFTPLFNTLVRYHWGHELMSLHFLLVGYLFFWGIIGIDPGPRKLPFLPANCRWFWWSLRLSRSGRVRIVEPRLDRIGMPIPAMPMTSLTPTTPCCASCRATGDGRAPADWARSSATAGCLRLQRTTRTP
jgi:Cytochrome c oxidase caa3 assembly factor (Caa3_CtaG)